MIVECHICESKVDAKVLASSEDDLGLFDLHLISLVVCPVCNSTLLATQEMDRTADGVTLSNAKRIWPSPDESL